MPLDVAQVKACHSTVRHIARTPERKPNPAKRRLRLLRHNVSSSSACAVREQRHPRQFQPLSCHAAPNRHTAHRRHCIPIKPAQIDLSASFPPHPTARPSFTKGTRRRPFRGRIRRRQPRFSDTSTWNTSRRRMETDHGGRSGLLRDELSRIHQFEKGRQDG